MKSISDPKFPELQPREKIKLCGTESLTNQELIKTIIGKGNRYQHVDQISQSVLSTIDNAGLDLPLFAEIMKVPGVNAANATKILAALELGRRYTEDYQRPLQGPEQFAALCRQYHRSRQEHLIAINLNGADRFLSQNLITVGTLDSTLIHPREVFAHAIEERAASVVLIHNHPSGIAQPSEQDIRLTQMLCEAGRVLGIKIIDHVIITPDYDYYSFKQAGLI